MWDDCFTDYLTYAENRSRRRAIIASWIASLFASQSVLCPLFWRSIFEPGPENKPGEPGS